MANVKNYHVELGPLVWGSIKVRIDFDHVGHIKGHGDFPTEKAIKESVEFWADWKERLSLNAGDYTKTFLKQLCEKLLRMGASRNLNVKGMIEAMKEEEGYFPLDGSFGITLTGYEDFDLSDQLLYDIEETDIVKAESHE